MERVAELLARLDGLTELTDDDLAALEADLRAAYDEIREGDLDTAAVEALGQLADGTDLINAENERREGERAELARSVEALDARLSGEPQPEAEAEPEPVAEEADAAGAVLEVEREVVDAEIIEADGTPAVVAAGRARVRVPRHARPVDTNGGDPMAPVLFAAPDLPNRPAGAPFGSWDEAADSMCARLASFRGEYRGDAQNVRVGTLEWKRPEERTLGQELVTNQQRLRQVTGVEAIVAAGGFCGPFPVRYGVQADVTAARPVRDSLPSFTADRGGMQYQSPVGIGDVDPTAIGTLTAAQDAAGATTKTIWCIPCSPTQTAQVDAIYERLCFSNYSDRYNPENMRAYMDIARAAWARTAERRLLAAMRAATTNASAPAVAVNSVRQMKLVGSYLRAWYGDRYRLPDAVGLVAYLPKWVLEMMSVDMSWQAPGDDTLNMTDAAIQAVFAEDNLRVIWTLESDVTGDDLTGIATPGFNFPTDIKLLVFPEGGFTFLDGGTLDFGIVRDSATNAKNRFETFFESFEAVAKTGYQGFNVTVPMCLSGAAAGLVAQACANTLP